VRSTLDGPHEELVASAHDGDRDAAAKEEVPAMNHEINLSLKGRLHRPLAVGEELVATTPAVDTGPQGQIEPEMGVR
jgi:hypothetical protein